MMQECTGVAKDLRSFQSSKMLVPERLRQKSALFLHDLAKELKISGQCVCTALIFMHRFYARQPIDRYLPQRVASAILFLTCKVLDAPVALKDIVTASIYLLRGNVDSLDENFLQHYQEDLITLENLLLATFGFRFDVEYPHKIIEERFKQLKALLENLPENVLNDFRHRSFQFAKQSLYLSSFSARYSAELIAAFAIELALSSSLPKEKIEPCRKIFLAKNSIDDVNKLIDEFRFLSENYPTHWFQHIFPSQKQLSTGRMATNPQKPSLNQRPSNSGIVRVEQNLVEKNPSSPELALSSTLQFPTSPSLLLPSSGAEQHAPTIASDLLKVSSTMTGGLKAEKRPPEDLPINQKRRRQ